MLRYLIFLRLASWVMLIALTLNGLPFVAPPSFSAPAQTTAPTAAADRLLQSGQQALTQQQFSLALKHLQAALTLYRQQRNQVGEGKALEGLGDVYYTQQDYRTAIEFYQKALMIWQKTSDRQHEAITLDILGLSHLYLGELQNALAYFNQALPVWRVVGDSPEARQRQREGEANTLNNIGLVYDTLGQKQTALAYYNQALPILRAVGDREGEANTLNNIGRVYDDLGEKQTALEAYNQALSIWRTEGNSSEENLHLRKGEANTLNNIGLVYDTLGEKKTALDYYNQALVIWQEVRDRRGEANTLSNIGAVYNALGERQTALKYYNQALPILRAVGDRAGEAITLNNIGLVYDALNEKQIALKYYNQAMSILRLVGDRAGEATTLSNIGAVYDALGEKQIALKYYNQALPILGAVDDRAGKARVLNNIGRVYDALGEKQRALDYYNQALPIWYAVGHREGAARTLNNMGIAIAAQNQPELAIVFYKQSVNLYETIRDGIRTLPRESQESYTQTVAGTYRRLADLLIEQGRIGEAQQVLERLKIQEINDFTKGTRTATTVPDVGFTTTETQIKTKHNTLIAFGSKFYECEQSRCPQLGELREQYRNLSKEFQAFVEEIKKQLREGRLVAVDKATDDFQKSADRVVTAHPNSILIYPLVLSDKTRLLWAGKGGVLSKTAVCPLGEKALYAKVAQFREWLSKPGSDTQLKAVGKELYDCLVKPLEGELTANGIKHLIFVPDRATNYIPMAALYDGQQYLIERYAVSTVLSAGLTDTDSRLPTQPQQVPVLGLGLSEARGNFSALPNVITELRAIIKTKNQEEGLFPGLKFLNQAFDRNALENNLRGHKVLHIATHGEFKPSNPRDSYFLLGTGTPYAIPDIQTLRDLRDVHLVVLSACETGLGGADSLGLEVAGISSFFLGDRDRAKAVMASLWLVNDASTSLLMQEFYKNLATGQLSKAEALRQAQLEFLQAKLTAKDAPQRSDLIATGSGRSEGHQSPANFAHPYYWAPFILIGNSL